MDQNIIGRGDCQQTLGRGPEVLGRVPGQDEEAKRQAHGGDSDGGEGTAAHQGPHGLPGMVTIAF